MDMPVDRAQQKSFAAGVQLVNGGLQASEGVIHGFTSNLRQQNGKFVAADSGDDIAGAKRLRQYGSCGLDQAITQNMPKTVIIEFQSVNIADDDRDRQISVIIEPLQFFFEKGPVVYSPVNASCMLK